MKVQAIICMVSLCSYTLLYMLHAALFQPALSAAAGCAVVVDGPQTPEQPRAQSPEPRDDRAWEESMYECCHIMLE